MIDLANWIKGIAFQSNLQFLYVFENYVCLYFHLSHNVTFMSVNYFISLNLSICLYREVINLKNWLDGLNKVVAIYKITSYSLN